MKRSTFMRVGRKLPSREEIRAECPGDVIDQLPEFPRDCRPRRHAAAACADRSFRARIRLAQGPRDDFRREYLTRFGIILEILFDNISCPVSS